MFTDRNKRLPPFASLGTVSGTTFEIDLVRATYAAEKFTAADRKKNEMENRETHVRHTSFYLSGFLLGRPDRRPVHAVDPVVQAARVAQMMPGDVPPPQRRRVGRAIHTLLDVHGQDAVCGNEQ